MEINRNQYFMMGLVILFLGIQCRMVESFVLTESAGQFVATQFKRVSPFKKVSHSQTHEPPQMMLHTNTSRVPARVRTFKPPPWLGWALVSIGAVLILHSLAMKRPD